MGSRYVPVSDPEETSTDSAQPVTPADSDADLLPAKHSPAPLARLLGISLVLAASFIFSGSAAAAKYLQNIAPGQFVMVRGAYALLLLLPASQYTGDSLVVFSRKPLVALRCISHGLGYCLKIWCVKNMRIGDAISIYFTAIIFAGFFSRVFLKEKYTLVNLVSAVFGISGVFLIAKPSFLFKDAAVHYNPWYCLLALAAACCSGVGYSAQRAIGPRVASTVTTFYTNLCVVVGGAATNFVTGDAYTLPGCFGERVILTACGVGACVGLVMLNYGLSIEKSAPATLMRNMDIVLAFLFQVLVFRETADVLSIIGAVLILTSTASVTAEKAFCPRSCLQI